LFPLWTLETLPPTWPLSVCRLYRHLIDEVGPADNYAWVPTFANWVLILDMLLGRLEIYTVIILLVPRFYKK
jgi:hypothetical protein